MLHLLGSYSPSLSEANEAFDEVLQKYRDHPLATYVEFVQGIRAAANYKTITEEGKVDIIHKSDQKLSIDLLSAALEEELKELTPITVADIARILAHEQKSVGDEKGAKQTLKQMMERLSKEIKNPVVLQIVEQESKRTLDYDLRTLMSYIRRHGVEVAQLRKSS